MRFSSALNPPRFLPQDAQVAVRAPLESVPQAASATAAPPWPADQPPDDLDQRVREVGEWQLGE